MGYAKAIITLLFLLIMALPTASAGWEKFLDDAGSAAEDWADEAEYAVDGGAFEASYPEDECLNGAEYAYGNLGIVAEYDYGDRSDYGNSDWENYEDGIIDNFHFNRRLGYPEYDSGNYQSQNEIDREVEIFLENMPGDSKNIPVKKPEASR